MLHLHGGWKRGFLPDYPAERLQQALATVESCDIVLMLLNKASRTDVGTYYGYYGDDEGR